MNLFSSVKKAIGVESEFTKSLDSIQEVKEVTESEEFRNIEIEDFKMRLDLPSGNIDEVTSNHKEFLNSLKDLKEFYERGEKNE